MRYVSIFSETFSQSMAPGETTIQKRMKFFPLSLVDIGPHFYRAFSKEISLFCIGLAKEKPAAAILIKDSYTHRVIHTKVMLLAKPVQVRSFVPISLETANLCLRMSSYEGLYLQEKQNKCMKKIQQRQLYKNLCSMLNLQGYIF